MILVLCSSSAWSQSTFRLSPKDSRMVIRGTSTLHSWQCRAELASGQMMADMEAGNISDIKSLVISIVVNSIRSIDENGAYYEKGMDKNVYKALKAEKFPAISFTLSKINKKVGVGRNIALDATGTLRIAGVTKEIAMQVTAVSVPGGVQFEGKVPIKMTDYNVEPPTAIFGTIQTGNEVTFEFKMVYLGLSSPK